MVFKTGGWHSSGVIDGFDSHSLPPFISVGLKVLVAQVKVEAHRGIAFSTRGGKKHSRNQKDPIRFREISHRQVLVQVGIWELISTDWRPADRQSVG